MFVALAIMYFKSNITRSDEQIVAFRTKYVHAAQQNAAYEINGYQFIGGGRESGAASICGNAFDEWLDCSEIVIFHANYVSQVDGAPRGPLSGWLNV